VRGQQELFVQRKQERVAALATLELQMQQRSQEIAEITARATNLERALEIASEELELTRPMVARGAAARIELIRLEARANELQGALEAAKLARPRVEASLKEAQSRRREKEAAIMGEATSQLSDARTQYLSLQQSMRADEDRIERTEVRAPVAGIIKTLNLTTIGQVVKPGIDILEIVPRDEKLLVEAEVRPQDIAFLRPGMAANVRVSAYDYTVYGSLPAEVERISADAISKDKGESVYIVRVRTSRAYLEARDQQGNGRQLPIIPGMIAEVDVLTGRKSVLTYMTTPLTRMRSEALRER
jgi:membrane fusion protein, adhesin transport system